MSAGKCPVCGWSCVIEKPPRYYCCGYSEDKDRCKEGGFCTNAEELAIERAAEVEKLRKELKAANDLINALAGKP